MKFRRWHLAMLGLCIAVSGAHAQSWPNRPIKAIVAWPAGGGTDSVARPVLAQMSKVLGQPIVVENRPGAGGNIGMAAVGNAEPDGYTLLVHSNTFTILPATYTSLSLDPLRDFIGVMPIASLPMVLVGAPDKGYKNLNDLITAAKAAPGKIDYASAGAGGATHLGAERFRIAAGFEAGVHVPYKGAPEAYTAVMTGRVDYYTGPIAIGLPLIKAGKMVALAVTSSRRSSALPDVPTTLEAGLPNSDYNVWVGVMVPARTPRAIVDKLHDAMVTAMQTPEVQETFKTLVAEPMIMSTDQFATLLKSEVSMNAELVKAAGVTVN
jgi:tripartite-type tricarboxylate transporter receptor subunit TctC